MTTSAQDAIKTVMPDLSNVSLATLADEGGTVLAGALRAYRDRLKENGVPLSSFNARI